MPLQCGLLIGLEQSSRTWLYSRRGVYARSLTPCRPANPSFSVDELVYQLDTTKAGLLFTHPSVYKVALEAAKVSGIPADRVVLIDAPHLNGAADKSPLTIEQLVNEGSGLPTCFTERKLGSGEGKTKVAVRRGY